MSEKENLTPFQIQLLLYYLTAEPKKRTVTDAARYLNKPKSTLTHILDSLDDLALMERVEGRKSVLTAAGERTAQQLLHQRKILEQYMQYQDIPPAQIKENALRALSAGFSDQFMERLAEQEGRMRLKEIFAGHRDFHGGTDIAAPLGTPILAAADGVVVTATWHNSYGYYVKIKHDDTYSTLYAHCSVLHVSAGQTVKQGQVIADCGSTGYSTGPHCHFEVIQNGVRVDALMFYKAS